MQGLELALEGGGVGRLNVSPGNSSSRCSIIYMQVIPYDLENKARQKAQSGVSGRTPRAIRRPCDMASGDGQS